MIDQSESAHWFDYGINGHNEWQWEHWGFSHMEQPFGEFFMEHFIRVSTLGIIGPNIAQAE